MLSNQKLALLQEIEQIPEADIPGLLELVRSFRQETIQTSPVPNGNDAITHLNSSDRQDKQLKRQRLQEMFAFWSELDDEREQQESLQVIQSLRKTSI
ncbi:hypothetical protein [Roseofilum casamattae]|uniref:Uncharacterized protein n=1 Tax=Roseofilum casamattae BLCC-M143 TaxID=3022442 RepID=A0ABT7BVQ3_9CYAN|nr:hypothetical protein [Roseofilum casamattae]MDJ1183258.1 hypothetical protein [Roseofilum casamattae BLCC-M143]